MQEGPLTFTCPTHRSVLSESLYKEHTLSRTMLLLLLFASLSSLIYYYLTKNYNYWEKRGVPYAKPSLFFGNVKDAVLLRKSVGATLHEIYKKFEGHPYVGVYELRTPALLLRDPKILKYILIKDFSHFPDRGIATNESTDPLTAHLINLTGARWRILRTKLTPAFTTQRMRYIFELVAMTSEKFKQFVKQYADNEDTVEFQDFAAKFTTEVIGSCCFGLETNAIQKDNSEFRTMCKKILDPCYTLAIKRLLRNFLPDVFLGFRIMLNPPEAASYFFNIAQNVIAHREKNNIVRKDFMQVLMEIKRVNAESNSKKNGETEKEIESGSKNQDAPNIVIDDKVIAAQMYIFLLAGFDTASTALSFTMFELAVNPDIQEKLHEEIRTVLEKHGSLSYDSISEMNYLDRVIRESMRKYPPVGMVPRVCTEEYKIPDTDLVIEKNMKVLIPIHAIHNDPLNYEEPEKFNPDRFLDNSAVRNNCIYLPFGEGQRTCIGKRFAYLQMKAAVIALLTDYEIILSPKTCLPLQFTPLSGNLATKSGIWLTIRHRRKDSKTHNSDQASTKPV